MPRRPSPGGGPGATPQRSAETPPGRTQKAPGESGEAENERLAKMLASGRDRLGDSYGTGVHTAQPVGSPVSCSGLINSMRRDAGLRSIGGTYDYMRLAQGAGMLAYRGSPSSAPAGVVFVATQGAGGPDGTHMSMSIGGGKVIESVGGAGVKTSAAPGSFGSAKPIQGIMKDVGTSNSSGIIGMIGESAESSAGILENLTEGIANGVLRAILTVAGFVYGYLILRLLDFWGGFWWEFTSKLLGEMAPWLEEVDLIKIATGQSTDVPALPAVRGGAGGVRLDNEGLNRLFFVLFCIFSYQLAWGRDSSGTYRMDNALGGLGNVANVDLKSRRAKNTRATLEAEVVAELVGEGVPETTARTVARKELKGAEDKEVRDAARRIIASKRAKLRQDPETKKFRPKVIQGGKSSAATEKSIENEAIAELVKMGVPQAQAERSVRRGNVREA